MPLLQTFGEDSVRDFGFADGTPIGTAVSGFYYMPINATITFTTNGSTGPNGPSLATFIGGITSTVTTSWASNTTYLNTSYFTGYFKWMVPFTGTYSLDAYGAAGGPSPSSNGSGGNRAYGQFVLASGSLLTIVLGQRGLQGNGGGNWYAGGGGGATTVSSGTTTSNEIPLIVGGGGGGSSYQGNNYSGDLPSTTTSYTPGTGIQGVNYGGNGTCAGGGFDTGNGGVGQYGSSWRIGGVGPQSSNSVNSYGGFGGGGAGGGNPGGGGGGFKGGFAGDPTGGGAYNRSGGSGANFNSGTNQISGVASNSNNNGYLIITRIA
jgi:hypothetical protein